MGVHLQLPSCILSSEEIAFGALILFVFCLVAEDMNQAEGEAEGGCI